jgi:hypothetical protein
MLSKLVREALYETARTAPQELALTPLLASIGALVMSSTRGRVAHVVTFNYDDLLEQHLRYSGYDVVSVNRAPCLDAAADVRVLHAHGLLPSVAPEAWIPDPIVITRKDYDRFVGNQSNPWRRALHHIMESHVCVFIGLSGNDQNLTSILADAHAGHPALATALYWGVRVDVRPTAIWRDYKIYNHTVAGYDDIPAFLFDVCRRAAELRAAARE